MALYKRRSRKMIYCSNHIVTGDGKTVIADGAILVNEEGKIEKVGVREEVLSTYPKEKVKDFGEASILPGLIDCHVHFGYFYSQPDAYDFDDYKAAYYALNQAKIALSKGITTVRDVSSPHKLCQRLKEVGEKGRFILPRIIHADTGICMTGGHGHDDGIPEVDGADAIRKEIRHQLRDGADWIKILTSNRSSIPEYTQEELNAAVDECHRRKVKCAVHAGLQPALQMSIDAGFDTIEHGTFLTLEQVKQMVANGQAWTPTITAYTILYEFCKEALQKGEGENDRIAAKAIRDKDFFEPAYNAYKNNFKKFYDTGVIVLAGTDMVLYSAPPYPIARELSLMVEYGITPVQAIQTATVNPAKVMELDTITGQIKEGLEADILVVEGDVSKDIRMLGHILQVYKGGRPV